MRMRLWPRKAGLLRAYPDLRGTLFIVTYGRSGSTLLQNLLMTIPGCTIRGENLNLLEGLWRAERRAAEVRQGFAHLGRHPTQPWFGVEHIRPEAFGAALVEAFVAQVLAPPPDARWFGFKEIRYSQVGDDLEAFLDFIRARFPNAHFIFNTRRGEAVAASRWWRKRKTEDVLAMVAAMDARFARYAAAHPDCCFETRYEDFTAEPEVLRPLFERLGEPFDPAAIRAVLEHRLTH